LVEIAKDAGGLWRGLAAAALALGALAWTASAMAAPRPMRIVSLDLCTDQLLVELADRERIAAVTHLLADPLVSAIPEKGRGIPATRGAAEDVLRYDPDLVLAGPFGVSATVALLRRLGRNVVVVPLANDLDGVRASVRSVAAAIGEEARGAAMIADYDRRLAKLPPLADRRGSRPTAVIYQVSGAVSGPGSMADAALEAAGFRNKAADYPIARTGIVPLEALASDPPDMLVLSSARDEFRTAVADNLRHPVIQALRRRGITLELPWRMWLCGTPHILDAVERLAAARARIEGSGQ
jgi:iron complex transport system substrate-binding protein